MEKRNCITKCNEKIKYQYFIWKHKQLIIIQIVCQMEWVFCHLHWFLPKLEDIFHFFIRQLFSDNLRFVYIIYEQKKNGLIKNLLTVIAWLSENERLQVIRMLQAGLAQNILLDVLVYTETMGSLWRHFQQSGSILQSSSFWMTLTLS